MSEMENIREYNSGNLVVLIDQYTRRAAESITYDALAKHVTVITDIRELADVNYDCDFVFFEAAVPSIVTPQALDQFVEMYSVHPHLVYITDEVAQAFGDSVHSVKASYKVLEWNLVYAVVNSDLAILEPYQRAKQEPMEFAQLIEGMPSEYRDGVNRMYVSYLSLAREFNRMIAENSRLIETVEDYRAVGHKTSAAIQELQGLLEEVTEQNRTYCAMLSESYDVTFSGMYSDRPKVLYIKSISHLAGIDTLLMVLYAVLTKQYKVSCKVVKLVDSANACSVRYIPNIYFSITDSYNTYDVLVNDFLANLGAYNVLMSLLMLNRSGLDYLIVHDMRGTMNAALDPSLIDLRLNEISGDYAVLAEYDNMLTSGVKGAQFEWDYAKIGEFTGTQTSRLANHPTVSHILDYLM